MKDMDLLTALAVRASVGLSRLAPALSSAGLGPHDRWRSGDRLKLLIVGYNGDRNVGADARTACMARQFEHVLGGGAAEITVLTQEVGNFRAAFDPGIRLRRFDSLFFRDVLEACSASHLAVLGEGAALTSKFANALTLFFCEAAGVMAAQEKPCLAYGVEAGAMDPAVRETARKLCRQTYFIARTRPSLRIVRDLGMEGRVGADPAWTFPERPGAWAGRMLSEIGWDGRRPLIGAAVTNPFWWPIKPSLSRLARSAVLRDWQDHYRKWYFYSSSPERAGLYDRYLRALARTLDSFAARRGGLILIFGMDGRDLDACRRLQLLLTHPSEIFSSQQYDGHELCALLRRLTLLVTSDYHGKVLSMPAGVPAVSVSLDERLDNLCEETGEWQSRRFGVDDPDLAEKLDAAVESVMRDRDGISDATRGLMPGYLERLGRMGMFLHDFVAERFPGLDLAPAPKTWQDALGPVEPGLRSFLE
jgi:polysaccharide pyruvyl transferase WcaK-like protein